jgi:hypothetical protein
MPETLPLVLWLLWLVAMTGTANTCGLVEQAQRNDAHLLEMEQRFGTRIRELHTRLDDVTEHVDRMCAVPRLGGH